jgi:hypothetical protein
LFLTRAIRLLLPVRGCDSDASSDVVAANFSILIFLCASQPISSKVMKSAFLSSPVVKCFQKAFQAENPEDSAPTMSRALKLHQFLTELKQHILPAYSNCVAGFAPDKIEGNIRRLLMSEIDRPNIPKQLAPYVSDTPNLAILSQYALLQSLNRQYHTLVSSRSMPSFTEVIPLETTTILRGYVTLEDCGQRLNVNFDLSYKILDMINPAEDQQSKIHISIKDDNDCEMAPDDRTFGKVEHIAQCIMFDLANLTKPGHFDLQLVFQQYRSPNEITWSPNR